MEQVLVFCRTNFDCDNLEAFLTAAGGGKRGKLGAESGKENAYSCCVLAGARSMDERRRNLQGEGTHTRAAGGRAVLRSNSPHACVIPPHLTTAFKDGGVRVLICTDVAARGIDISGLPYVVNLTLPDNEEDYIHRVGRVGRADTLGLAVSIVASVPERVWFCRRKGYTPWTAPTAADVAEHTVWFDEPALLARVEARLGAPVALMGSACELPPGLGSGGDAYGKTRADTCAADAAARSLHLAPAVAALSKLEHAVQRSYWELKSRYGPAFDEC
jgi:ATP-dependent RNA helicase DDX1